MRRYDFAIVGFGSVGRALARLLQDRRARVREQFGLDPVCTWAIDSSAAIFAPDGIATEELSIHKEKRQPLRSRADARGIPSPAELRATGVEGVAECLPTEFEHGEPGLSFARDALDCGLDLVFADKGPVVRALPDLEEHAERAGVHVGTSATTGSTLPTLDVLRAWFAGCEVREICGILNGTSNLVLTRMRERSLPFADALAEAKRAGIAEPDPRLDVEGIDTAIKLAILARGLMDPTLTLDHVECRGITELSPRLVAEATEKGGRLRLVGRAERIGRPDHAGRTLRIAVAPEITFPGDVLHETDGANKAVRFSSVDLGDVTLQGGASSLRGTASALLRDLIHVARQRR